MSSKNDESSGMIMAVAFVGAGLIAIFMVVFALLAFVAFVLTIACLFAWNKPLTIGKIVIEPEEARGFVARGFAGAVVVPAFLVFVAVVFGMQVEWQYFFHFVLAGYVGGSIGLEMVMAQQDQQNGEPDIIPPSVRIVSPPRKPVARTLEQDPFRFASWNDEEERE